MRFFLVSALLLISIQASVPVAKGTVVGYVRGENGEAVSGALLTVLGEGTILVGQSDASGKFSFSDLRSGFTLFWFARQVTFLPMIVVTQWLRYRLPFRRGSLPSRFD